MLLTAKNLAAPVSLPVAQTVLEEEKAATVAQTEQRAQAVGTTEATIRAEYETRIAELETRLDKQLDDAVSKTELSARKEAEAKARRKHEWEIRKLQDETAVTLANVKAEARAEGEAAARRRYEAELKKLREENAAAVARAEQQAQTALLAATDERTVRSMQSALADLGYYDGKVDGVVGPKSRAAVSAFQSTKGYAVDGSLTTEQLAMLLVASVEKRREQGSTTEDAAVSGRAYNLDFGKYHALIIGNDEYTNLRNLKTAVADATAVAKTLKDDYGFETRLLTNATRAEILGVLNELRARLGDNDNLLIYYAGHGVMDWEADVGYWLPVDAAKSDDVQWLANDRLTRILKAMQAKHVMIVADSCYSGSLVRATKARTKIAGDRMAWLDRMNRKRGRTVMTSGGLEPVLDDGGQGHSVFAKAFLDALRENDGVIEGQELFAAIQRPVVVNSDQTPDYADIRRAGHDGGDFLFVRR